MANEDGFWFLPHHQTACNVERITFLCCFLKNEAFSQRASTRQFWQCVVKERLEEIVSESNRFLKWSFCHPFSGLIFKFSWNGDLKVGLEAHVMFVKRFFSFYPMARSNSFYEKKWFPFLPWSRAAWKCSLKLRGGSLASLNTGTRLIAHK